MARISSSCIRSSNTANCPRPADLARYIAVSAQRSMSMAASAADPGRRRSHAMPTLADTDTS